MEGIEAALVEKFARLLPHLDERRRRLVLGADARALGHGGIRVVARAAGVSEDTVSRGAAELDAGMSPSVRVRRPGAGRKRLREHDPGLVAALLALVEPGKRGDPESPLRWTTKSTRKLAAELSAQGYRIGADTVAAVLKEEGFCLRAASRTIEGARHPDRDAQFRYINDRVCEFTQAGEPVISVDTKKEVLGDYAVAGREWHRAGQPVQVRAHDFPEKGAQKAVLYGIYDLAADAGWVSVGCDGDTAAFAVATLRRWWDAEGRARYPDATRLLITADAGGANGCRVRAWKKELADFTCAAGLEVMVCHFPPGTSKWNKIEHRLFSRISTNWRGRPLTSHEVVVNTIGATTTRTGPTVRAELDSGAHPTGTTVPDHVMDRIPLEPHEWHGTWNYSIRPEPLGPEPLGPEPPSSSPEFGRFPAGDKAPAWLHHPSLTGMEPAAWQTLLGRYRDYLDEHPPIMIPGRKTGPGTGSHCLSIADRLLVCVLKTRWSLPQPPLASLLGVSEAVIGAAVRDVGRDLAALGHTVPTGAITVTTAEQLAAIAGHTLVPESTKIPK
ncbi:ISAzo13 family transposase [Streptomyces barringtoniae]|uniref:ISAzo13 family transposase n=1 Tax=Streptomyces barringtoniae TaxID=2892029 RepID=UPI001E3700BE|nr:ISAzo13 family transposase [Streptomyces barringtoniae]MCC5474464.1 ISAzo13 family transposase [Streptomyces barringtoniae]